MILPTLGVHVPSKHEMGAGLAVLHGAAEIIRKRALWFSRDTFMKDMREEYQSVFKL